eukprot:TRINITY_DN3854_c0_g1_i6.p2 TRINITY_DN3854_c0_g1~~TRINITY_DN3854_c0_g1_i6.p2  ORF type:complete len:130 (-),score=31.91 TRINITY_DN3854_c0_g1_i6:203-592(-)
MKLSFVLLVFLCAVSLAVKLRSRSKMAADKEKLKNMEKKFLDKLKGVLEQGIEEGSFTMEDIQKLTKMDEGEVGAKLFFDLLQVFQETEMKEPAEYHMVDGKRVRKCKTIGCEIFVDMLEYMGELMKSE